MTRNESGQLGGVEAVAFGLLVLIIGVLLISNAWGVIDAEGAAQTAAREAARTYAKTPAANRTDADAAATQAARDTLGEMGWRRAGITIRASTGGFVRCASVTYVVSVPVPVFRLPWLGAGPPGFHATAHHTELVDPYRSGVPGPVGGADCAAP